MTIKQLKYIKPINIRPHKISRLSYTLIKTLTLNITIYTLLLTKLPCLPWQAGNTRESCQTTGNLTANTLCTSNKLQNKTMHTMNGNKGHSLTIAQWNMGPARWHKKRNEIEAFLQTIKPDLFFITEANFFTNTPAHEKIFPGHKLYLPLTGNRLGYWRIVLIAKEDLLIDILEDYMETDISSIWVRVGRRGNTSTIIGSTYREHKLIAQPLPNLSGEPHAQTERLSRTVNMWKKAARNRRCTLLGDINLDFKKWETPEQNQINMVNKIKTDIEMGGFTQLLRTPTRFWSNQEPSIPDHIWTNTPERVLEVQNLKRAVSDHNATIVRISLTERPTKKHEIVTRSRKNFNLTRYQERIGAIDWTEFYKITDVNILNDIFCTKVVEILDSEAPIKVIQSRKGYRHWLSEDTKTKMTIRDTARDDAIANQSVDEWRTYRKLRNQCTKMTDRDRKAHLKQTYHKIAQEKDTKKLHKTTRELLGWTTGGPPSRFLIDGKVVESPRQLAMEQMKFYTKKLKDIRENLPDNTEDPLNKLDELFSSWEGKDTVPVMEFRELTDTDILGLVSSLGNSTSWGHDKLDAFSLKLAISKLYKPLGHIVNSSLRTGTFANVWRLGKLIPLHKGKDSDQLSPSSYRPISLLTTVSKITERATQVQLSKHLEENGLLHENHHSYRNMRSTTTALLQMSDYIYQATEENCITSTMTIDLSNAFECVHHQTLLRKLEHYNLGSNVKKWLASYLTSRSNYVSIGNARSNMVAVNSGVPQGSVLGPLLFIVYTNEFPDAIRNRKCDQQVHLDRTTLFHKDCMKCGSLPIYADDATFLHASKSRTENQAAINENLEKIKNFLASNKLAINITKTTLTEYMIKQKRGRTKGEAPQIKIEKTPGEWKTIKDNKTCRILGATFQNNLNWQSHLITAEKAVLPEARRKLGALYTLRKVLPQESRLQLATNLIISKLVYLVPLWGGATFNYLRKAQILMNRAARFVTCLPKKTRIRTLLEKCNWLDVIEMTTYHSLLQVWKIIRTGKPEYLRRRITVQPDNTISTTKPRLQFTATCFRWRTTDQWNSLPEDIRGLLNFKPFKQQLRKWILDQRLPIIPDNNTTLRAPSSPDTSTTSTPDNSIEEHNSDNTNSTSGLPTPQQITLNTTQQTPPPPPPPQNHTTTARTTSPNGTSQVYTSPHHNLPTNHNSHTPHHTTSPNGTSQVDTTPQHTTPTTHKTSTPLHTPTHTPLSPHKRNTTQPNRRNNTTSTKPKPQHKVTQNTTNTTSANASATPNTITTTQTPQTTTQQPPHPPHHHSTNTTRTMPLNRASQVDITTHHNTLTKHKIFTPHQTPTPPPLTKKRPPPVTNASATPKIKTTPQTTQNTTQQLPHPPQPPHHNNTDTTRTMPLNRASQVCTITHHNTLTTHKTFTPHQTHTPPSLTKKRPPPAPDEYPPGPPGTK